MKTTRAVRTAVLTALFTQSCWTIAEEVPKEFDCEVRKLAVEYAFKIQPFRGKGSFQELVDTLNLHGGEPGGVAKCFDAEVPSEAADVFRPKFSIAEHQTAVFVDAKNGDDEMNDGSLEKPFSSVHRAMEGIRSKRKLGKSKSFSIVFRGGVHYFDRTVELDATDSALTFQNFNGEEVWLSGAKHVPMGKTISWNQHPTKPNVWVVDLSAFDLNEASGLRIGRKRAVRARYPNGCTSQSPLPSGYKCMGFQNGGEVVSPYEGFGSNLLSSWVPPDPVTNSQANWFQYDNSKAPKRPSGLTFNEFNLGVGGTCKEFSPPAGYWCGNKCSGGAPKPPGCIIRYPKGVSTEDLPNAPYKNPGSAVVQSWRPGHWSSWMFQVSGEKSNRTHLMFEKGGFQGGRGENTGEAFFVENVEEELDADNEFFYDENTKTLQYYSSKGRPPGGDLEIPTVKTLFRIRGTMEHPVKNVHILGVGIRDTRLTYLDEHIQVSGGDWGLNLRAAVEIFGADTLSIDSCTMEELDGNAILAKGYVRNLVIQNNDFHLIGGNIIAQIGDTEAPELPKEWGIGWDGSRGTQPRGSIIRSNFGYRCGLFAKQSAFYFQAKSMGNLLQNNIYFHGPRAGINFNDGFGGGNVLEGNLLFATVMETGDHGPFNSWDRQPYAHKKDKDGNYVMVKDMDEIRNNFWIGNYYSQETVDNDDGSAFYNTHHNFLVYGDAALKSDFGGHTNYHHNNLFAFIDHWILDMIDPHRSSEIDKSWNNTVIFKNTLQNDKLSQYSCECTEGSPINACPVIQDNKIHTPSGTISATLCGKTFDQLVQTEIFKGSTVSSWPSTSDIIQQARGLLGLTSDSNGLSFEELQLRGQQNLG